MGGVKPMFLHFHSENPHMDVRLFQLEREGLHLRGSGATPVSCSDEALALGRASGSAWRVIQKRLLSIHYRLVAPV